MASSTLHLIVEKGPKQGETLARNPGTVVRIGRVIRGNTFAIKDPAISQKHLTIEFTYEISRWTVKDLDTSNGTVINDAKISSSIPFPLSDGDTIKIGETTSISVKIDGDGEIEGGLRPGKRRGARSRVESLASVLQEETLERMEQNGEDRVEEPKHLRRGRPRRGDSSRVSKKDENLDAVVGDCVEVMPRRMGVRTRGAAARVLKEEEPIESNVEADSMMVSKENELLDSVVEDSIEAPKNVKRGRPKKAPARSRPARSRPARTRASTAKVSQADEFLQSDSLDEEVGRKGEINVEGIAAEEGKDDEGKEVGSAEEENEKRVEEETVVDFEKMTLGEWFDSMEKYLPQSINEVAEQMIANLREKARRFDEYIVNVANDS